MTVEREVIMANPDLKRNTDAPATITGFYYQIIIVCREICKMSSISQKILLQYQFH